MDHDAEITRAKWFFGALALLLITGFYSFDELKYTVRGNTVQANVIHAKEFRESGLRGRSEQMLSIEYSFPSEGGGNLIGRDQVSPDWPVSGNSIMVQQISGTPDSSRVAGNSNMGGVSLFLASLAVIAGVLLKFYLEAKASERRSSKRFY